MPTFSKFETIFELPRKKPESQGKKTIPAVQLQNKHKKTGFSLSVLRERSLSGNHGSTTSVENENGINLLYYLQE